MHFSRARLRGHRDGQKRSQSAVAEAAGLCPDLYDSIEIGAEEPTQAQEQALAAALGVRRSALASLDPSDYWADYADAVMSYARPLTEADIDRCAQVLAKGMVQ